MKEMSYWSLPGRLVTLSIVSLLAVSCSTSTSTSLTSQEISQQEFLTSPPAGAMILDVRTREEFNQGHIPGAVNISHDELSSRLSELDSAPDRPIVVYCASGRRAGVAASLLVEAGYTRVLHLEGDMNAWHAKRLPTE